MPTIGTIKISDIIWNIKEVVLKPQENVGLTKKHGARLLIDEIALEETPVYFKHSNTVGGLCWKHTAVHSLVLNNFSSAENIAKKIADGLIHISKEMTVITVSLFGEKHTLPILAAPTCKQETAEDMQDTLQMAIMAWESEGAEKVGPLWSVATDGNATRRRAGYKILSRLNLCTGKNEVTLDFDFRHIFKWICTLLRLQSGIVLNNGRVVNPNLLSRYLPLVPGYDTNHVTRLLVNPDNSEDVPRAVELKRGIIMLGKMPITDNSPEIIANRDAIRLLGELLEAFLAPFTTPSFSLSDCVRGLSKFASIRRFTDGSEELGLAKQQLLNSGDPFYPFDVGDNALEELFGRIRMIGGHNAAMNYKQGAVDIDAVLKRNPDMDPGSSRTKIDRIEGVDHLNKESWTGDVTSGSCDIGLAWKEGSTAAANAFRTSQVPSSMYDHPTIFRTPGVDLLRPFGGDKYPGIENDGDRSVHVLPSSEEDSPPIINTNFNFNNGDLDEIISSIESTSLEDQVEEADELALPSGPGIDPNDYLSYNGRWIHKATVVRLILCKNVSPKSKDRLRRVAGFSSGLANRKGKLDLNTGEICGADVFVVGDPVVTLLRSDKTLSLTLLRTTDIKEDGTPCSSIPCSTIENLQAKVALSGQILTIAVVPRLDSDGSAEDPSQDNSVELEQWAWMWDGCGKCSWHERLDGNHG
ncbi:hypothetical protein H0H81_002859 [Sphagnurus paluster]|uniref:Uncharacterized protein n=1 Tax=Sphagnurus paluster TaxID=117069 RepID=A0A9P7FSV0_9AGAR|nr:hypothetical protein H0H81_002859 [Sphagnurus paluster]